MKEFNRLPKTVLQAVCKSDGLACKESELFDGVVSWGKTQCKEKKLELNAENLKKALEDVLALVRFPIMETTDVAVKVAPSGLLESDQVLDLFTYLGMRSSNTKTQPGRSLAKFSTRARVPRRPPAWFKWDNNRKNASLQLSPDGLTVYSHNTSGYQPVFGDIELKEGVWEWEIVLQQYAQSAYSVMIGVVPAATTNWTSSMMIGYSGHVPGWSFCCGQGQKFDNGTQTAYGRTCNQGDIIRVKLNLGSRSLEFSINGTTQGVAFTNINGPVRPAISLYGVDTCVLRFPSSSGA